MKKILKKFLVITMFFIVCINYIFPIYVHAESNFDRVAFTINDSNDGRENVAILSINGETILEVRENKNAGYEEFFKKLIPEYFNYRLRVAIVDWMAGNDESLQVAGTKLEAIVFSFGVVSCEAHN